MMPVLFIGHGSPMNVVEDNAATRGWRGLAASLPKPEALLVVTAHWFTRESLVSTAPHPKMIYDFYGFPEELYHLDYPAPGAPELAKTVIRLSGNAVRPDPTRGFDHGTWSVLRILFPQADVPVLQLSVNASLGAQGSFLLGQRLRELRKNGVMIIGSGNVVHNLAACDFSKEDGYGWADAFDRYIRDAIQRREFDKAVRYGEAGPAARKAFVSPDHYYPLLYTLGAADASDTVSVINDFRVMGALSMSSYLFS